MHIKYTIQSDYFSVIDTEQKAYILGILYADGCVSKKNNSVSITLQTRDEALLSDLKLALNSTHPIKKYPTFSTFTFTNKQIHKDLINWGCVPAKSKILKFPSFLSSELLSPFLRGYFDGDGSISNYMSKTNHKNRTKQTNINVVNCSITSSADFISNCMTIVKKEVAINCKATIPHKDRNTGEILTLNFYGKQQIKKFLDYIYKDATIKLQHKYNKYLKLVQELEEQKNSNCVKCNKPVYSDSLCQFHYKLQKQNKINDTCILCANKTYGYNNLCKKHGDQLSYYKRKNNAAKFFNLYQITEKEIT